jgi:ABC-type proline/glycine betaine transport system permease subunit
MKDTFVSQCLDILKREDIKNEFKSLMRPIIDFILTEIYPYIYLIVILVFLIFVMILAILFILIFGYRNKQLFIKNA